MIKPVASVLLGTLCTISMLSVSPTASAGVMCISYRYAENLVRRVQEKLNEAMHTSLRADGKWGPQTRSVLGDFQRRNKLRASNELDEGTFHALFGADVPFEGVDVVKNPLNVPQRVYDEMCPDGHPR